ITTVIFFFFQAEDGIRDRNVTGVQTCALPIYKLNENRNMSELFQETKELNELMKSYIRVHMNEEMAKEVTIHNQLNQIQEKSDNVMSNMQSILNTQGKMLEENAENLQAI